MSDQRSPEDGSMTLDDTPLSPRPSLQQSDQRDTLSSATNTLNQQDMTARQEILDPPPDWSLNVLLTNIAKQLTEDDFKTMKNLFEGEGGIGKGLLETMKTPADLFRILKERGYLSRDNLLHLQAALFWTGRKDLVKEAQLHARTIGNIIHFYSPPSQPENGYRFAKFHVDGIDFQTFSRENLVKLRQTVSKLLMVPERFVIIVGVEPASSIVVTLMIPDLYVEIFLELLSSGEQLSDLIDAGVDSVEIDEGTQFRIEVSCPSIEEPSSQQTQFANVYQQLRDTKTRLENTEAKLLDLCHSFEEMDNKLTNADCEIKYLNKLLSVTRDEKSPASLQALTALNQFTSVLRQISKKKIDRYIITRLIDSTVQVVETRMRDAYATLNDELLLSLRQLQSQLIPLKFDLERYKFYTQITDMDKFVSERLQFLGTQTDIPLELNDIGMKITKELSNKLSDEEKAALKKKYKWTEDGTIEAFMNQDASHFMAGIFYKEVQRTQQHVNFEAFMQQCMSEVKRHDLVLFLVFNFQQQQHELQQQAHLQQQQKQKPQKRQQQAEGAGGTHSVINQRLEQAIMNMATQMQTMHDMITSKQAMFAGKFDDWKTPQVSIGARTSSAFYHAENN